MTKQSVIRWALDVCVVIVLAYAGWSFKQFTALNESDIIQRTQIASMQDSVGDLSDAVNKLVRAVDSQNKQLESIFLLMTFRTDPWSGTMMIAFYDDLKRQLVEHGVRLEGAGMPMVLDIQRKYQDDFVPNEFHDRDNWYEE